MKIKNEYVKIKTDKKELIFNNLILDTYLRHMAEIQEDFGNRYWQAPFLSKCYVKFDRKLDFDVESILYPSDFDVEFNMTNNYISNSTNKNEIEYVYRTNNRYSNKKITAIGFFANDTCYACLDLYDYSLMIKETDNVSIVRKDIISTEATFNSSTSKVSCPIHLTPLPMEWYETNPKTTQEYPYYEGVVSAHIYSVGLGTNKNEMQKEVILDANNTEFFGNKIIFRDIFSNENLVGILEPNINYPNNNLYPTDTENYFTHVFIKYKLYYNIYDREGSVNYQHVDTGEWYTLSIPITTTGDFDYAIKYERSDNNGI